jgi:hypothetical protein
VVAEAAMTMTLSRILLFSGVVALAAACGSSSSQDASLTVVVAAEDTAFTGFAFPPVSTNDPAFVDGWQVSFDRILVTVDAVTLADSPDTSPTDQAQTGRVVAHGYGPWAVDLTKLGGPVDLTPKIQPAHLSVHGGDTGPNPSAQPLVKFGGLDSDAFDTSVRYAFGFSFVPATATAKMTNLDANAAADYGDMVQKGGSVLYVGTATFKGKDCTSSNPDYKGWDALPKSVRFRFLFRTPTSYVNCQNTDLKGKPFPEEEAQRGVQVTAGTPTFAQITLHVDHPFWSTVDHDAAQLYFDQIAAAANADGVVTLDDLAKLDPTGFRDAAGVELPWRSCLAATPPPEGTRGFDTGSVLVDPKVSHSVGLRNYADFMSYLQSTQGHMNADGLCAVQRKYPSPR